jgi:predicted alpha/beta hydrolase family esterase
MEQIREWLDHGNRILLHPGWHNSGPAHWQSHWQNEFPGIERVEQSDWAKPVAADWVRGMQNAARGGSGRVIVVAHSLGCLSLAHWSAVHRAEARRIAGALLVAPADPVREGLAGSIRGFLPMPQLALPYPAIVVASDNDPYCSVTRTEALNQAWQARMVIIPQAGHINVEAGFGPWPQGLRLLRRLIRESLGYEFD